ncbi:uncharacterized protein F4822DRAFT_424826 [Hypoxylon trugodes]|uniref:uncharacterized protein n=1 Tax=Hypoxylon trugodes TaxID=326681 RepID=UPI00219571C1|nr:uncharacterized protein F4822DRAFT_424826 [Hypoxylon trugodes]KAI1394346.1 hypothetical protein F4822DRAFT_424826 [Hypoxylon trugodes]
MEPDVAAGSGTMTQRQVLAAIYSTIARLETRVLEYGVKLSELSSSVETLGNFVEAKAYFPCPVAGCPLHFTNKSHCVRHVKSMINNSQAGSHPHQTHKMALDMLCKRIDGLQHNNEDVIKVEEEGGVEADVDGVGGDRRHRPSSPAPRCRGAAEPGNPDEFFDFDKASGSLGTGTAPIISANTQSVDQVSQAPHASGSSGIDNMSVPFIDAQNVDQAPDILESIGMNASFGFEQIPGFPESVSPPINTIGQNIYQIPQAPYTSSLPGFINPTAAPTSANAPGTEYTFSAGIRGITQAIPPPGNNMQSSTIPIGAWSGQPVPALNGSYGGYMQHPINGYNQPWQQLISPSIGNNRDWRQPFVNVNGDNNGAWNQRQVDSIGGNAGNIQ